MRTLWTTREIDAPASDVWSVFTDLRRWPEWGPSVRSASLDGDRFETGATGRVVTALGPSLPFELTEVVDGSCWSWRVLGIPATTHRVDALGEHRCRAAFGVPVVAAPYLVVCKRALAHIDRLAAE